MSTGPLSGLSVVVTRTRSQAGTLAHRLAALGAEVVELPVISTVDPVDGGAALARAADRLVEGSYRWVVLTSSNAVARLLGCVGDRPIPGSVRWAAVGRATSVALGERGIVPGLVPPTSTSDALCDVFPPPGRDETAGVLYPRAETVQGIVADGLRRKGWTVDEAVAYRTVRGRPAADRCSAAREADAIVFTSSSTVEATIGLLGAEGLPPMIASIGPSTSETVRAAGLDVTGEADPHSLEGLVEVLVVMAGGSGPGEDAPPGPRE